MIQTWTCCWHDVGCPSCGSRERLLAELERWKATWEPVVEALHEWYDENEECPLCGWDKNPPTGEERGHFDGCTFGAALVAEKEGK